MMSLLLNTSFFVGTRLNSGHPANVVEHVFEDVTDDEVSDVEEYATGDDEDPGSSGISVILIQPK